MKPMLASDWDEKKVRFPVFMQPKIDGVRAMHLTGLGLTGRSLKAHANKYVTRYFSNPLLRGFDGEMAANAETSPALCRDTSSALSKITGEPWIQWHLFEYLTPDTIFLPYFKRMEALGARYRELLDLAPELAAHLKPVLTLVANTMQELEDQDAKWLEEGYEGTILRDPMGLHKQGRSTAKEGGLLRIKRFVEEEAIVLSIEEGQVNNNVATTNELGYTERSTHMANMVPNGMVGAMLCRDVKTAKIITVSAGSMSHADRKAYFDDQEMLIGEMIKYKCFPKGVKDKPRFPTFQSIRVPSDIS